MTVKKCRVCGNDFFADPLLTCENMPKAAQYLPDATTLKDDQGVTLQVFQCSVCGLVQLISEPVPYYKEVIRAAGISEEMQKFRRRQFGDFVKKYKLKGKKVIEIGSGRGEYLTLMRETGADAYGLEQAAEAVKHGVAQGLKVTQGFVQSPVDQIVNRPFAAFFILNFLEHLPDLNETLRGIYNNLAPAAVGLVEVPNFDMMIKQKLFSEFIFDHLFYFTQSTLKTALNLNGFEVIECRAVWHDYIISAVVKKKGALPEPAKVKLSDITKPLDLSAFNECQVRLKREIDGYLSRFPNKRVAIWGAGHQALAVMALADLAGKIKYVVDSAPFKQDKYTPATHIPILPPDTLKLDPVDAVIIMAASYSDEVARIIKKKYNNNLNVCILRDFGLEIVS